LSYKTGIPWQLLLDTDPAYDGLFEAMAVVHQREVER
jgi:hypothetical protein